jgi:hypothetical protein
VSLSFFKTAPIWRKFLAGKGFPNLCGMSGQGSCLATFIQCRRYRRIQKSQFVHFFFSKFGVQQIAAWLGGQLSDNQFGVLSIAVSVK